MMCSLNKKFILNKQKRSDDRHLRDYKAQRAFSHIFPNMNEMVADNIIIFSFSTLKQKQNMVRNTNVSTNWHTGCR